MLNIVRSRRGKEIFATLITLAICAVLIQRWPSNSASRYMKNGDSLISMCETRVPGIPENPEQDIDFVTLCTLNNYLYAQALGAHFRFTVITDKPDPKDASLDPQGLRRKLPGDYCVHPKHGLMPANFCRMPLLWNILRDEPDIQNIVHIDSDAIFRSTELPFTRHVEKLDPAHPLGMLSNAPYDGMPCTGYMFMTRGNETRDHIDVKRTGKSKSTTYSASLPDVSVEEWTAPRSVLADFLKTWWDTKWTHSKCHHLKDQCTLWGMMGVTNVYKLIDDPAVVQSWCDKLGITFLADEPQFVLESDDQMIFHQHHIMKNRYESLRREWQWEEQYPINNVREDRERLRQLLAEVDMRRLDVSAVAADWDQVG